MAGMGSRGTNIRAGVVTAAEVNVPPSPPSSKLNLFDTGSGAMWAFVWFVVAIVMLYVIL